MGYSQERQVTFTALHNMPYAEKRYWQRYSVNNNLPNAEPLANGSSKHPNWRPRLGARHC
jgi:hypothetical protein